MVSDGEINQVTICGVGLMGGSLALAIKMFHKGCTVFGVDFPRPLERAIERNALDRGFTPDNLVSAIEGSEVIFLATPIKEILSYLDELGTIVDGEVTVSDLGSTKRHICTVGKNKFCDTDVHFVGGHPMTGSEKQSIAGANPLLFENSVYILTPPVNNISHREEELSNFLSKLGAQPRFMDPESHDEIVARISHLPQIVALGLMNLFEKQQDRADPLSLAGGGFRDMTRIAQSPYEMWEDIFDTNDEFIKEEVNKFIEVLQEISSMLGTPGMSSLFQEASRARSKIPRGTKGLSSSVHRIAAMVPDRPGALAELTSAVAKKGINIKDIELKKVREDYGGTFHVYFADKNTAEDAVAVLNDVGFSSRVID